MPGPWRNVVHIESREGPKGGRFWWLTLDCGHFASRHQFVPKPQDIVRFIRPLVKMRDKVRRPTMTAPYRVCCLHCSLREDAK